MIEPLLDKIASSQPLSFAASVVVGALAGTLFSALIAIAMALTR